MFILFNGNQLNERSVKRWDIGRKNAGHTCGYLDSLIGIDIKPDNFCFFPVGRPANIKQPVVIVGPPWIQAVVYRYILILV